MALPTMNEETIREFLSGRHVGVLGINRRKGGPQLVPVWYTYEDGCVLIPTELRVAKVANIARDPEVSFCVDDKSTPHKGVVMYCTAEVIRDGIVDKRREIMSKYVGDEEGAKVASEPRPLGMALIKLTPHRTYSYDYSAADQGWSDIKDYR